MTAVASEKLRTLAGVDRGTTFQPKWKEKYEEREFVRVAKLQRADVFDRAVEGPYFVPTDKWQDATKVDLRVYELMTDHDVPKIPLTINMRRRRSASRDRLVPIPPTLTEEGIDALNDLIVQEGTITDLHLKMEHYHQDLERIKKELQDTCWERDKLMIESARKRLSTIVVTTG